MTSQYCQDLPVSQGVIRSVSGTQLSGSRTVLIKPHRCIFLNDVCWYIGGEDRLVWNLPVAEPIHLMLQLAEPAS